MTWTGRSAGIDYIIKMRERKEGWCRVSYRWRPAGSDDRKSNFDEQSATEDQTQLEFFILALRRF
jgi:hypothetical protein